MKNLEDVLISSLQWIEILEVMSFSANHSDAFHLKHFWSAPEVSFHFLDSCFGKMSEVVPSKLGSCVEWRGNCDHPVLECYSSMSKNLHCFQTWVWFKSVTCSRILSSL